jgi:glycerol-1-phosphate dehydrogenase [NAD(P)+]
MNHIDLLATSFDCGCGKRHVVPTEHLVYREDAYDCMSDILKNLVTGRRWLIVADKRTYQAAGLAVETALEKAGAQLSRFIIADNDGESPAADDVTMKQVRELAPQTDLYIAVGSGVVNDLVKWVAYLEKRPYVTVPTAASMNGYASANVAATVESLKVLFHADACKAAFVDPIVLKNAPTELTGSGLGDVLAKSVSSADWKLNNYLFGDYYCQFAVDLLKELEPVYLNNPLGIKDREPAALQALFEALFYSSIAMTITGTSSPASGGEHLISHTLDMIAGRDNRKHDFHGRQVGVSSILMAALYERVMSIDKPIFKAVPEAIDRSFWGDLSPVVEKEYLNKLPQMEKAAEFLSNPENLTSSSFKTSSVVLFSISSMLKPVFFNNLFILDSIRYIDILG